MLIDIKFEKGRGWSVDENIANLIPETRAVLNSDKLGVEAVCVIALCCDPLSTIVQAFEGKDDRIRIEAVRCVYKNKVIPEDFYKQKGIQEAINIYKDWCDTPTAKMIAQMKESTVSTMENLHRIATGGLSVGEDGIETTSGELKITELIKAIQSMPNMIKDFMGAIGILERDSQDVKARVKGDRILTPAEARTRQKQSKAR